MSLLLVLVAHNGKTLQLDVHPQTRIDAVQAALVSTTGVSVEDQILMCNGARLDAIKPLAAYKLPVADPSQAEELPVFLYHKGYLRPGSAPPAAEPQDALPLADVTVAQLPPVPFRHPLADAPSPLVRALPDCEASFQQHLMEARAHWEASQQRMLKCRQLLSEQEVQARAADAARANVESHFTYICNVYTDFCDRYVEQHTTHSALLAQFDELTTALVAISLPEQLQTPTWRVLADVTPQSRLNAWRDSCKRARENFSAKVLELESLFQLLRKEVEALFLQVPSVDLDALGRQLVDMEGRLDEEASIVQVLAKDLATVRELVEATVQQLGAGEGSASGLHSMGSSMTSSAMGASRFAGVKVTDALNAVDTMHDHHMRDLLPRARACDADIKEHLLRVASAKGLMGRDVCEQLQRIALQQSRIRDMKNKLAAFNEVLVRQEAAVAQLRAVVRLPAAYRFALTECLRRQAWLEMYSAQAVRLAEHMGRIRTKEASKREAFLRQVERYLPQDLLARAGLLVEPPHCQVSVPACEQQLLPVTLADIQQLPPAVEKAAADLAASQQVAPPPTAAAGAGRQGRPAFPLGGAAASGLPGQLPFSAGTGASALLASRMVGGAGRGGAGGAANEPSVMLGGTESMMMQPEAATFQAASASTSIRPGLSSSTALPRSSSGSGRAGGSSPRFVAAQQSALGAGTSMFVGAAGLAAAAAGGLEMENARLKAELAAQLALQCIRELSDEPQPATAAGGAGVAPAAAGSTPLAPQQQQAAEAAAAPGLPAVLQRPIPSIKERLQQQQGLGGPPVPMVAPSSSSMQATAASPSGDGSAVSSAGGASSSTAGAAAAGDATGTAAVPWTPGLSAVEQQQVLRLAPVKAALAAKDAVCQQLQAQLQAALAAVNSYEGRITELETLLAAQYQQSGSAAAVAQHSAATAVQQQLLQEAAAFAGGQQLPAAAPAAPASTPAGEAAASATTSPLAAPAYTAADQASAVRGTADQQQPAPVVCVAPGEAGDAASTTTPARVDAAQPEVACAGSGATAVESAPDAGDSSQATPAGTDPAPSSSGASAPTALASTQGDSSRHSSGVAAVASQGSSQLGASGAPATGSHASAAGSDGTGPGTATPVSGNAGQEQPAAPASGGAGLVPAAGPVAPAAYAPEGVHHETTAARTPESRMLEPEQRQGAESAAGEAVPTSPTSPHSDTSTSSNPAGGGSSGGSSGSAGTRAYHLLSSSVQYLWRAAPATHPAQQHQQLAAAGGGQEVTGAPPAEAPAAQNAGGSPSATGPSAAADRAPAAGVASAGDSTEAHAAAAAGPAPVIIAEAGGAGGAGSGSAAEPSHTEAPQP